MPSHPQPGWWHGVEGLGGINTLVQPVGGQNAGPVRTPRPERPHDVPALTIRDTCLPAPASEAWPGLDRPLQVLRASGDTRSAHPEDAGAGRAGRLDRGQSVSRGSVLPKLPLLEWLYSEGMGME